MKRSAHVIPSDDVPRPLGDVQRRRAGKHREMPRGAAYGRPQRCSARLNAVRQAMGSRSTRIVTRSSRGSISWFTQNMLGQRATMTRRIRLVCRGLRFGCCERLDRELRRVAFVAVVQAPNVGSPRSDRRPAARSAGKRASPC